MSTPLSSAFESLISEAIKHEIRGWDFSHIEGRIQEEEPGWNYKSNTSIFLMTGLSPNTVKKLPYLKK